MAFMIVSPGSVARSETRTMTVGVFGLLACVLLVAAVVAGAAFGYLVLTKLAPAGAADEVAQVSEVFIAAEPAAPALPASVVVEAPDSSKYLIDRVGELAGRMIQLEAEAAALVERIGAIQDFEARIGGDDLEQVKGRLAKTPPGAPSGGPHFMPVPEAPTPEPLGSLLERAAEGMLAAEVLEDQLVTMESEIARLSGVLADLDRIAVSFNLAHLSFPGRSPMPEVAINSAFGNRIDPFTRKRAFHSGVDYPAPRGTPIHASAGGRVIYSGRRPYYGNTVEIDHGAGLVTRYAHAHKLHVNVGQVVMPGELIAEVGSTGRSTGPHLHFEILKDGHFVDPTVYLARF